MRVGFAGGGVMAEAMFSRAIASGLCAASDVSVGEPVSERRAELVERYGVAVHADNVPAVEGADIVVIAVKPQHTGHVFHELHGRLDAEQTVLSIAAGVTIGSLAEGLGHDRIIRVMPNTPAQIGAGMSVWTATPEVPDPAREAAAALLGTLGRQWRVDSEDYLDMATAVSGSGPAYVFAFIEALTEAGVFVGMPRDMAQTLAVETALGSARLASESGEAPAILRERVTSPGGTTAAALRELERKGFKSALIEAVTAAFHRSRELGGKR